MCCLQRQIRAEMPGTWIDQCADIARQLLQRTRGVRQVTAGLTSRHGGTVYSIHNGNDDDGGDGQW